VPRLNKEGSSGRQGYLISFKVSYCRHLKPLPLLSLLL
jgi:hypothetical protein